jgi:hypothetical protein
VSLIFVSAAAENTDTVASGSLECGDLSPLLFIAELKQEEISRSPHPNESSDKSEHSKRNVSFADAIQVFVPPQIQSLADKDGIRAD